MAKRSTRAAKAPTAAVDDMALYMVRLNRTCQLGGRTLRPRDTHRIRGRRLMTLGTAIASVEKAF